MRLLFFVFLSVILLQSCEKSTGNLGLNALPESDLLSVVLDTALTVENCYTAQDNQIVTSSMGKFLGAYNDPIFGMTIADLAVPLYASDLVADYSDPQFKITAAYLWVQRDSTMWYGDLNSETKINVYRLDTELDTSNYEYAQKIDEAQQKIESGSSKLLSIGSLSMTRNYSSIDSLLKYDSVLLSSEFNTWIENQVKPLVKIVQDTITKEDKLVRDTIPDEFNKKLYSFFKGVYLKTDRSNTSPAMRKLSNIKIRLHYSTSKEKGIWDLSNSTFAVYDTKEDTVKVNPYLNYIPLKLTPLLLTTNVKKVNEIGQQGDGKQYVQSLLGSKMVMKISSIGDRYGDKYFVNRALLSIPIDVASTSTNFPAPNKLILRVYKNQTHDTAIVSFSATRDTVKNSANEVLGVNYTADLTPLIMGYIPLYANGSHKTNTADYRYEYVMEDNLAQMNRVVLKPGVKNENIKLKILYTKYK